MLHHAIVADGRRAARRARGRTGARRGRRGGRRTAPRPRSRGPARRCRRRCSTGTATTAKPQIARLAKAKSSHTKARRSTADSGARVPGRARPSSAGGRSRTCAPVYGAAGARSRGAAAASEEVGEADAHRRAGAPLARRSAARPGHRCGAPASSAAGRGSTVPSSPIAAVAARLPRMRACAVAPGAPLTTTSMFSWSVPERRTTSCSTTAGLPSGRLGSPGGRSWVGPALAGRLPARVSLACAGCCGRRRAGARSRRIGLGRGVRVAPAFGLRRRSGCAGVGFAGDRRCGWTRPRRSRRLGGLRVGCSAASAASAAGPGGVRLRTLQRSGRRRAAVRADCRLVGLVRRGLGSVGGDRVLDDRRRSTLARPVGRVRDR